MTHHRCQHCGLINAEVAAGPEEWRCSHCRRPNRVLRHVPRTLLEQVMQTGDGRRAAAFRRAA
jgi:hypothetical protein